MSFTPDRFFKGSSPLLIVCWLLATAGLVALAWIVGRPPTGVADCGVFHGLYVLVCVLGPGAVALRVWWGRRLSWSEVMAVGLPLGIVMEALVYPAFVMAGVRDGYVATPAGWLLLAWFARRRIAPGGWLRWPRWENGPAAAIFVLAGIAVTLGAVSMHSVAVSLEGGVLAAPTHHDWIYLLARAREIVTHDGWEDPSLAGVRLSYHYLLLLHSAAASTVTGVEIDTVLFRTGLLPLGGALLAQGYWLGRRITRRAAGGMLAMLLLLLPAVEWTRAYEGGPFMDFFNRWLLVSPTFYLGLVFFGALTIGIFEAVARPSSWRRHVFGLLLLAAGGALAKATVVPALAVAVSGWALAGPVLRPRGRRFVMMVGCGAALTIGWWAVYALVLSDWGSGYLRWAPGATLQTMPFGREFLERWSTGLGAFLPSGLAALVGTLGLGMAAVLALSGIRAAAFLLLLGRWGVNAPMAAWMGWCVIVAVGAGLLITLDSSGQLYFLLPMRLPLAVLGAAGLCALVARLGRDRLVISQRCPQVARLVWPGVTAISVAAFLASSGLSFWVWAGVAGAIMIGWPRRREAKTTRREEYSPKAARGAA